MSQTTVDVLSSVPAWYFDTEGRYIAFRQDGTGELWCACNFNYWIAAELEWTVAETAETAETADMQIGESPAVDIETGNSLRIQMKLTTRLPPSAQSSILTQSTLLNEHSLGEEAFKTKSYTVHVEKGRFTEPSRAMYARDSRLPQFDLRLVFDPSPYPPKCEWKAPESGGVVDGQFWHHTQFVASST
ncbi:hypothetical protein CCM_09556 [Cordyceps militaris CM01]|uniref:Uncharacterized protein n=1 Tax=Cordyceps militaris (strain CM01) TaxID=983644 RepID=G3JUF9_CORMM|nr:uncharacterized protein CCM_09556 [Cordyceps militaris CM01]EGX87933.1 hypothetical protein CCM_09556 [Cordyceps militaris CM01]